jgi:hypothetical protein
MEKNVTTLDEASPSRKASPVIERNPEVISHRGKLLPVDGIQIDGKRLVVQGRFLTVAQLRDEWYDECGDPELMKTALMACSPTPDIFTFCQRLPDTIPAYAYYHEPEALSAIPLHGFQHWWDKQIKSDTRKKAKRAEKRGIEIKVVSFDDALVRGVIEIFNETPVRRGKPFWHYRKSFDTVKEELSRDLAASKFIGAYEGEALVGFVKLVCAPGRFANPGLIVSKLEARKKYVNNALMAKSVEVCCEDGVPYLTYTKWRRGTQAEFLIRHGFEKTLLPRYWIPLTKKGTMALQLGLHRDIRTRIPDGVMRVLLGLREAFYSRFYRSHGNENRDLLGSKAEIL